MDSAVIRLSATSVPERSSGIANRKHRQVNLGVYETGASPEIGSAPDEFKATAKDRCEAVPAGSVSSAHDDTINRDCANNLIHEGQSRPALCSSFESAGGLFRGSVDWDRSFLSTVQLIHKTRQYVHTVSAV